MDCSLPGSSVCRISQQEYWSGLPFPFPGLLRTQGSNLFLYQWLTSEAPGLSRVVRETLIKECNSMVDPYSHWFDDKEAIWSIHTWIPSLVKKFGSLLSPVTAPLSLLCQSCVLGKACTRLTQTLSSTSELGTDDFSCGRGDQYRCSLAVVEHGLSCSAVHGIFANQGLNLCPALARRRFPVVFIYFYKSQFE